MVRTTPVTHLGGAGPLLRELERASPGIGMYTWCAEADRTRHKEPMVEFRGPAAHRHRSLSLTGSLQAGLGEE
jgi:hypothetical protein